MKSVRLSERMKSLRDEITCGDEIRVFTRVIMIVGSADTDFYSLFFFIYYLFFKREGRPLPYIISPYHTAVLRVPLCARYPTR